MPGATVVVTDESTNVTRETQTDLQGAFEVPNLRPGTYAVTATLSGFKKVARTGVVLRAGSTARADFKLEVGGIEDVVTVGTAAAFLYRGDEIGTLRPGLQADLVVLRGDPVRNISAVRSVDRVMVAGKWIDLPRYRTY